MARRSPTSRPTYCPACDNPLDAEIASEPSPVCPACNQPLEPVRVAGFWRRTAAALVDGGALLLTAGLLNWALLRLLGLPPLTAESSGLDRLLRVAELEPAAVAARIAPFLTMAALYCGLFWVLMGRTIGQRFLGVRVVDAHGRAPTPMWVTVRIVGLGLGLAAGGLGWIWAAFDLEKRGWHDHLARTYVVVDEPRAPVSDGGSIAQWVRALFRHGVSSSNDTGRATKARSPRAQLRRSGLPICDTSGGTESRSVGARRLSIYAHTTAT